MKNPFTPGVGLEPPYLAGREEYINGYVERLNTGLLQQKNTIITGLRGVGKSVLLKRLTQEALLNKWIPIHREVSKRSNRETELISALLADIALRLKGVTISQNEERTIGISPEAKDQPVDLDFLIRQYQSAPGDTGDKFAAILKLSSNIVTSLGFKGIVLMLDEFQLLEDNSNSYSLTLILDAISKLQSSTDAQVHGVFAGLPTMIAKMAESKPHVERLFTNTINLGPLDNGAAEVAITEALKKVESEKKFSHELVKYIVEVTEGYPYFIQYFSDAAFKYFQHAPVNVKEFESITPEIFAQLDVHFYIPRLSSLTDKERAVCLASADCNSPFSPTEMLAAAKSRGASISMGTIQQYLLQLQEKNVIYKVRRGKYEYALPLFKTFLKRLLAGGEDPNSVLKGLGQN